MTDRDEIELPPLPPFGIAPIADEQTVRDYARSAVRADRERRREQPPANPVVHSARLILSPKGYAWTAGVVGKGCFTVTLSWTDDGRVWIDNERNRELAQWLRMWKGVMGNEAADALDGGVR